LTDYPASLVDFAVRIQKARHSINPWYRERSGWMEERKEARDAALRKETEDRRRYEEARLDAAKKERAIGVPGFLSPFKCYKGMLTEEQAHFNKYHQLTRSPSERVNARLHAFHVKECRRFGCTTTRNFVRQVVLIDSMTTPPATEYLHPRFCSPEQPWKSDAGERDAIGAVLVANKDHIQWHGRASKKRSREKPGRKPVERKRCRPGPRSETNGRGCFDK
jgi:hypothetical protein